MKRVLRMRKQLDSLDIKILEALGIYGPRNISKLAKRINVPTPTVRDRVGTLKSHFSLFLRTALITLLSVSRKLLFSLGQPLGVKDCFGNP